MSNKSTNIVPFPVPELDMLAERGAPPEPKPATTPQITHTSTAAADLRRPKMRQVAAAVADLGWENGVAPAWLSRRQRNLMIQNACRERATIIAGPEGEMLRNEPPGPRTIDRYFTGK